MINKTYVGDGRVYLLAGGGKTYTDVAAKFCRTSTDVDNLIASPQNKKIIKSIIESNHSAALEFDDFIFGVELFSRVTEVQLVRKRHASYMISSGRDEKNGKRKSNFVVPKEIETFKSRIALNPEHVIINTASNTTMTMIELMDIFPEIRSAELVYDSDTILELIDKWYTDGIDNGVPEELLRYIKPQGTEFKAAIKMNAAGLRDWAKIRMCKRAQTEIRDLCCKMIGLASDAAPELFEGVGSSCRVLGYCPEQEQCDELRGIVPTKKQALAYLDLHRKDVLNI